MASTYFVENQLNRVKNLVIEQEFPEYLIPSGGLIDVSDAYGPGVDTFSFDVLTKVGQSAILANGAEDIPMINVHTERRYGKFYTIANGYSYTLQDMNHAEYAGINLNAQMAIASREVMEAKADEIGFFGETGYDLQGFVDYPGVPSETAPQDNNGDTEWSKKTPAEIYNDLRKPASDMRSATTGKYSPAIYALPQEQFDLINETPYPDSQGDETILSFFLKTQRQTPQGVQEVIPAPRLKGAFTGGVDGLIAFTPRPDRQEFVIGEDYTQEAPQLSGLTYRIFAHMRVGGTVIYRPYAVRQLTGI
jgi:hypothetical protein